jgi:hypothetical protein
LSAARKRHRLHPVSAEALNTSSGTADRPAQRDRNRYRRLERIDWRTSVLTVNLEKCSCLFQRCSPLLPNHANQFILKRATLVVVEPGAAMVGDAILVNLSLTQRPRGHTAVETALTIASSLSLSSLCVSADARPLGPHATKRSRCASGHPKTSSSTAIQC